jgi:acyl carrier protein
MTTETTKIICEIIKSLSKNDDVNMDENTIIQDLNIDSLSMIEVFFEVENKFAILIPDGATGLLSNFKTIGDIAAAVEKTQSDSCQN